MHIQIRASAEQKSILLEKKINSEFEISWFINESIEADAYIDLEFEWTKAAFINETKKPVLVNSVIKTCESLPSNYARINAWNGFIEKEKIETTTNNKDLKPIIEKILNGLGFEVLFVPDIVGLVSLRAISMIINEAFFGLEDNISSKKDIDTAMKLGTNYPYGPFEWSEKMGLTNIALLLIELSKTDSRYTPSKQLLQEAKI